VKKEVTFYCCDLIDLPVWCHVTLDLVFQLALHTGPFHVFEEVTTKSCTGSFHSALALKWFCLCFPWWIAASECGSTFLPAVRAQRARHSFGTSRGPYLARDRQTDTASCTPAHARLQLKTRPTPRCVGFAKIILPRKKIRPAHIFVEERGRLKSLKLTLWQNCLMCVGQAGWTFRSQKGPTLLCILQHLQCQVPVTCVGSANPPTLAMPQQCNYQMH
jgi:hypothetical protein